MGTLSVARLEDIRKVYRTPGDRAGTTRLFTALDGVTLEFISGEIHTLLGENGAGKSSLVHVFSGLISADGGTISLDGKPVRFRSPADALEAGIAMVHQRPLLSNRLTVLENCLVGQPGFLLDRAGMTDRVQKLRRTWKLRVHLHSITGELTQAERLETALLAALCQDPSFLILDEPTAVLPPDQREEFMEAVRKAAAEGLSVIMITHNLSDALRWSDRITILSHGNIVHEAVSGPHTDLNRSGFSRSELEGYLNPHTGVATVAREVCPLRGPAHLVIDNVGIPEQIPPITLYVKAGSITGIFGQPGSRISLLEDLLSGMVQAHTGSLTVRHETGREIRLEAGTITPRSLRNAGIGIVPSDRNFRASHPLLTVSEILSPCLIADKTRGVPAHADFCRKLLSETAVEVPLNRKAASLSGGQLQRIILSRELALKPDILILAEPEWGLDLRSAALLRERLTHAARSGMAILILTDTPETMDNENLFCEIHYLGKESFT